MANHDNEIVTLTLTRKQADNLSHILMCVYSDGTHDRYCETRYPPKSPRYKNDKEVRAAARSIRKLTDLRRKSVALDFQNDWYI